MNDNNILLFHDDLRGNRQIGDRDHVRVYRCNLINLHREWILSIKECQHY